MQGRSRGGLCGRVLRWRGARLVVAALVVWGTLSALVGFYLISSTQQRQSLETFPMVRFGGRGMDSVESVGRLRSATKSNKNNIKNSNKALSRETKETQAKDALGEHITSAVRSLGRAAQEGDDSLSTCCEATRALPTLEGRRERTLLAMAFPGVGHLVRQLEIVEAGSLTERGWCPKAPNPASVDELRNAAMFVMGVVEAYRRSHHNEKYRIKFAGPLQVALFCMSAHLEVPETLDVIQKSSLSDRLLLHAELSAAWREIAFMEGQVEFMEKAQSHLESVEHILSLAKSKSIPWPDSIRASYFMNQDDVPKDALEHISNQIARRVTSMGVTESVSSDHTLYVRPWSNALLVVASKRFGRRDWNEAGRLAMRALSRDVTSCTSDYCFPDRLKVDNAVQGPVSGLCPLDIHTVAAGAMFLNTTHMESLQRSWATTKSIHTMPKPNPQRSTELQFKEAFHAALKAVCSVKGPKALTQQHKRVAEMFSHCCDRLGEVSEDDRPDFETLMLHPPSHLRVSCEVSGGSSGPTVPCTYLNDDYCDCESGADEPFTSACGTSELGFTCGVKVLAAMKVNDGVCDCCDGSDEPDLECHKTC